jgi:NAD(P)-dependent dehydrogenase (short-subunit alcohol dehydrogenase family)
MGLLQGRHAVVTGGGSGIGRATCLRFAAEGATVAVLDIDEDSAQATAKEIDGIALAVDVSDAEALRVAVDAAASGLGGVSILVNNAGGSTMVGLADWDPDEWDRIVRLNLTGVFNGMRAGVPHLLAGGGGAVVNTASISGTRPSAGETPYSAAKAGVIALTASAALEYGPVIRVNAVAPGMIRTNLTRPLLEIVPDADAHYGRMTPAARVGEPEDIADVMVFLCSDLARFITGQTIVVDGGMTLHGAGVDGLFDRFFAGGQS